MSRGAAGSEDHPTPQWFHSDEVDQGAGHPTLEVLARSQKIQTSGHISQADTCRLFTLLLVGKATQQEVMEEV